MEKATPVQMRTQLEMVESFRRAGILFVPMPAVDKSDAEKLTNEMVSKIEKMEMAASGEPEEPHTCLNCLYEPEWKTRTEFGDCKWNPKKPPHSAVRIEKSSIYKNDPITNCPAWRPKS